jgi:hypothetical protein
MNTMNLVIKLRKTARNYLLFLLLPALVYGCQKWIDPEINKDPNQPAEVTMETLLSFIEADIAFKFAGGIELIASQAILMQQFDGIDRQMLPVSSYQIDPINLIFVWGDAYAEVLMDASVLSEMAETMGSPHNSGVSAVLSAFTLAQLTDAWGDVPWSEALRGGEITQPRYDAQEMIYQSIHALLDKAIDSLSVPSDPFGIKGDYFYNGEAQSWLRAAHALKARYHIHLSNPKGGQAYIDALEQVGLAFTGTADDMRFPFGKGESESNPLYQFMRDRNDIRMGAYFIELLQANVDPRLPAFAYQGQNGEYSGSAPGQANIYASPPGPALAAPDAPTYIITYTEMLFIKAEAMLMTAYNENEVKTVLADAVASSLSMFNVEDDEWMASYIDKISGLTGEDLYREIMTQKYISTVFQPEAYHSWRRTDYPVLTPNPGGATPEIPTRLPYPTTELVYNANVPKGLSITDHVWWD